MAEVNHRLGPWKPKQAVKLATLEWLAEFETNYHRQRADQTTTVWL